MQAKNRLAWVTWEIGLQVTDPTSPNAGQTWGAQASERY